MIPGVSQAMCLLRVGRMPHHSQGVSDIVKCQKDSQHSSLLRKASSSCSLCKKKRKKKGSCFILESPNLCPIIHLGQGALPKPKTFHRLDQLPVKWPDTRTSSDRTAPCWVLSHVANQSLVLAEALSRVKAESTGQRERDRTKV